MRTLARTPIAIGACLIMSCHSATLAAGSGAGPLDFDPSYGDQGRVSITLADLGGTIGPAVVQEDGKLVVTGYRTLKVYSGYDRVELFIRRHLVDGTLDTEYGDNGETRFTVRGADTINYITLQPDGKALLAVAAAEPCTALVPGYCANDEGEYTTPSSAIVRLTEDGMLDTSLNGTGIVEDTSLNPYAVAAQPDGKLLLLGNADYGWNSRIYRWVLSRFTAVGAPDPDFNGGSSVLSRCNSHGYALALQSDGGIIVAGSDPVYYGDGLANPGFCIERRLPDGSPDEAFNGGELRTGFGINVRLHSITLLPDGKLLAIGSGSDPSLGGGVVAARYDETGVLDASYASGGTWFKPLAPLFGYAGFTFARDGGFVAAGHAFVEDHQQYQTKFLKVGPHGDPDPDFGVQGIAELAISTDYARDFLRDIEDRWLLVSTATSDDDGNRGAVDRLVGERPAAVPAVEFFNVDLGHYFLTASAAEASGIDAGAAGPGWQRTGAIIPAFQPIAPGTLQGVPQRAHALCRFYGTPEIGPNSHFYTISDAECEQVRRDPGWTFENYAFYAYTTVVNATVPSCADGLQPVYRLYNDRFAQNDSNHRYTTDTATYQQMQEDGWLGEGVVFCAPTP